MRKQLAMKLFSGCYSSGSILQLLVYLTHDRPWTPLLADSLCSKTDEWRAGRAKQLQATQEGQRYWLSRFIQTLIRDMRPNPKFRVACKRCSKSLWVNRVWKVCSTAAGCGEPWLFAAPLTSSVKRFFGINIESIYMTKNIFYAM